MCHYAIGLAVAICCLVNVSYAWSLADRKAYSELDNEAYNIQHDFEDFLIDERQSDNYVNADTLQDALTNLPANDDLFEGDMVMDSRLRDAVLGRSKKSVVSMENVKWPGKVLVYDVDKDFAEEGWKLLKKAIHEFETRTCIRFKKRTTETDYVYYSSKVDMCSSNIGKVGGKQVIHIGIHCMVLGTVLHETMHALGFIHEHSRADRDQFLNVKWDNIDKKEWANFNKYAFADTNNEGVEYNFASVMHYRNDAFTRNGKDTLIAKHDGTLKFGQRIKFSVGDVAGINRFYQCQAQMKEPNYKGLFKDYSGIQDNKQSKRLSTVFKNRFFDLQNNRN